MSARRDVVVVGGGHNGLACAALLARNGHRVTLLEARETLGGCAVTREFHPGFKAPTLAHTTFPLRPRLLHELDLKLELIDVEPRVQAPLPDGRGLALFGDPAKSAASIRPFSEKDAARYPEFDRCLRKLGEVLDHVYDLTPPDVDKPTPGDAWGALKLAVKWRRLGREDAQRLLRFMPMSVADLVSEWFLSEPLRAVIAARALRGSFAGPRSAGTAATLLLGTAAEGGAAAGRTLIVRGGPGAMTEALAAAARRHGVDLRTGAKVGAICVEKGNATGVVLASGEELPARAVVSSADPKTTFLGLVDPAQLDPLDREAIKHYRQEGMAAKVHLALGAAPSFKGIHDPAARIHIGPTLDALERAYDDAKYGALSKEPYIDVTIPTLVDASLAPEGRHVLSAYVQFTPRNLKGSDWTTERARLTKLVLDTLEPYAPGIASLVIADEVVTPEDIERDYGIAGGHPMHGEASLEQFFAMRPIFGWGRYKTPIGGLYLCGAGAHPGGGLTGAPGTNAAREIARELKARRAAN